MWSRIKKEPVLFQGLIQAALGLFAAFWPHISPQQLAAILALTAAVLSFVTRQYVTPTK
jgi:uncharacterized membrane protein HdeD (DUF308 family)